MLNDNLQSKIDNENNCNTISWSHTQAQMRNGVQLGFSIDITF